MKQHIKFNNKSFELAGNIYFPVDFSINDKYPTIFYQLRYFFLSVHFNWFLTKALGGYYGAFIDYIENKHQHTLNYKQKRSFEKTKQET